VADAVFFQSDFLAGGATADDGMSLGFQCRGCGWSWIENNENNEE
jgi:hypothetical protein